MDLHYSCILWRNVLMVIASHFIEVVTLLCTKWSQEWFPLVLQVKVEKHTKLYT